MGDKKNYKERFKNDAIVKYYDNKEYHKHSYYSLIWELEKEILFKEISNFSKSHIDYLDFACGTGRVISFLENYVATSIGVDISKNMLNAAENKVKTSKLIQRDIIKNPLNQKFDVITSFRFFLNAENNLRKGVLKEIKKMMKTDSIFIFSIHGNKYSFRCFTFLLNSILFGKKLNQMSYFDVVELLDKEGFVILNYYGLGFLPKFLYRLKIFNKILFSIDKMLAKINILRMFSHNLIFVVKKNE
ncbi:MAG: class I SAM-dependent DNA methyltransferase [Candidatus Woesearchaeota archaeon]